jgi:hypothetical protein
MAVKPKKLLQQLNLLRVVMEVGIKWCYVL